MGNTVLFGLDPKSMPSIVVITPLEVEDCFEDFQTIITSRRLSMGKNRFSSAKEVSAPQILRIRVTFFVITET